MSATQVLILEDEPLIAMSMQMLVEDAGFSVLGPFADVETARRALEAGAQVNCALLDCNLGEETSAPVADMLAARGVPFAFTSGQGARDLDKRFASRPVFAKPVDESLIKTFLRSASSK